MFKFFLFVSFGYLTFARSNPTCENAYCLTCGSDGKCTDCINDYLFINGECKYMRDENCDRVDSANKSICTGCLFGYKLDTKTGKCVPGEDDCRYYTVSNNTITCGQYFCGNNKVVTNHGCIDCSSNPFCQELEKNATDCSKCKMCGNEFKLVNGKCQIIDKYRLMG